jgi:NADH dehydrogenase
MPAKLSTYARERLTRRRVAVRTNAVVQEVEAERVRFADGTSLATETVVWTAGVKGDPRVARWGLSVGRGGRVPVTEVLNLEAHPEIFVIGDLAYREDAEGRPLPQVAQVAIQQGIRTAANLNITWLVGFRNRALVLLNWGWNYVFYRRAVRLILPAARAVRHESL